jgi:hypothetical protein
VAVRDQVAQRAGEQEFVLTPRPTSQHRLPSSVRGRCAFQARTCARFAKRELTAIRHWRFQHEGRRCGLLLRSQDAAGGRHPAEGDVILTFVVGELQGGVGTLAMIRQGLRADYFINAEPTDL